MNMQICFRSNDKEENAFSKDKVLAVADGTQIHVHSRILAEKNPVFRSMFWGPFADSQKALHNISSDPHGFHKFLV